MTAADLNVVEIAREVRPSPAATLAAWYAACLDSSPGGGTNLLRHAGERYVIGDPSLLRNGAMTGHIHQFTRKGLTDLGPYKIGADGRVLFAPRELLGVLPGTVAGAPRCVCGSDSEGPHVCGVDA